MEINPLVSILMTAFNREKYIAEAIESVLASSYSNFELIIVDDASADNTVAVAKKYGESDKRVKVHLNQKNLGDYANRNKAASYANGEFIMYVDSDDTILPGGMERLIETMNLFPKSAFGMYSPIKGEPYELKTVEAIHNHFFKEPFLMMGPGGTIQRLSFFKQINGYPEKYGPANDMYYNLKACCHSSIVILPFEFMCYRRHDGQEINNVSSYLYNTYLYLRDALAELPLPLDSKQKKWLIKKNKRRFAVNLIKLVFSFDFPKIKLALKKTKFTKIDFMEGIFH